MRRHCHSLGRFLPLYFALTDLQQLNNSPINIRVFSLDKARGGKSNGGYQMITVVRFDNSLPNFFKEKAKERMLEF